MKAQSAPKLEPRRSREFLAELLARARAWMPEWGLTEDEPDFGRALLEIAARFNSEVAERLDNAGEKMRSGLLDWLGVRGAAARPARTTVVFKLADTARTPVLAVAPVRLQADAAGTPVALETEEDVRIVPGKLAIVVGVDADNDAFFLPPPGLSDLNPLEPSPPRWLLKSYAAPGATKLQLDPEGGLPPGTLLAAGNQQYRIVQPDKDLVTIDPPLVNELPTASILTKVMSFAPFDEAARNCQEHALYLGDSDLLNIESAANIEIVGARALGEGVTWEYWGKNAEKTKGQDEDGWQPLKPDEERQKTLTDALALTKPKGAIELYAINGTSSRWIRAYAKGPGPYKSDEFSLRVNAAGCDGKMPCPASPTDQLIAEPDAEGMANTTPLVISNVFFPLGKEPRQFDAFYLGSQEAFSKRGAQVQLCFEMADTKFAVLTSLRSASLANQILGGVAADGHLHLLSFDLTNGRLSRYGNREPIRPPSPGTADAVIDGQPIALDRCPPYRAAMWMEGTDVLVAVAASGTVWLWREVTSAPTQSGWQSLGVVGPVGDSAKLIEGLVYLADGVGGRLFALRESKLFVCDTKDQNATWKTVVTTGQSATTIGLKKIAPIGVEGGDLGSGTLVQGLLGIGSDETLYAITFPNLNNLQKTDCEVLLKQVAPDVAPAAVRRSDGRLAAVAVGTAGANRKLLGFLSTPAATAGQLSFSHESDDFAELEWPDLVGNALDIKLSGGQSTFVLCLKEMNTQATALAAWSPFGSVKPATLLRTQIPSQFGAAAGAPTFLSQHVIVPLDSGEVIVAEFDPGKRLSLLEKLRTAVVATAAADQLALRDQLAIPVSATFPYQLKEVTANGVEHHGQTLYDFDLQSIDKDFFVYRAGATEFTATVDPNVLDEIKLDAADTTTAKDTVLLIKTDKPDAKLYLVKNVNAGVATLHTNLDVLNPTNPQLTYKVPEKSGAHLLPLLPLTPATGNWDAGLLERTRLIFPKAEPKAQTGIAFKVDDARHPELVLLTTQWVSVPPVVRAGAVEFLVDASVGEWTAQLGDPSSNPDLSWEYWNGTGWWKIDPVRDETLNFKRTGVVKFTIPADMRATDWSGKTNHWIRARLIGGDYGHEQVTVRTKSDGSGGTVQTVERSSAGIRAPLALKLYIAYAVCEGMKPTFVLTKDGGTFRDQSEANRTFGAIVEAFIPLAVMLGRLAQSVAVATAIADADPECDCGLLSTAVSTTSAGEITTEDTTPRAHGRSLFLGLTAPPAGTLVRVLLLVDESQHAEFAPLKVEALVADRFIPIVADDATRALSESGLLTMNFALPPTPRDLFGNKSLIWLWLKPKEGVSGEWNPTLRGAYLNAVWASAKETMTRELLGSSDGAPNLVVRLARPPVLHDTLELRVKEPLGEEERNAFLKRDANSVLSTVEGLPDDWVLWKQVPDPDDEPATERVYALDETTGEIRFGDGRHGMIPPIGRDSIVAFSYCHTESDPGGDDRVPGNSIAERTALNLVSPVESVESVTTAQQAAGGAPTESAQRVLQFGFACLRHRNRAVTARDLEDLALQSSRDIVQARAFVRQGYTQLIVVMRGENPLPNAAQVRELRRVLLDLVPPSLRVPKALRIAGPMPRRLRIELRLLIESLDRAGKLEKDVKAKLGGFFDTATGGPDKDGWPLGVPPTEDDVAFTLFDVPSLESIENVALYEITGDGQERPWPAALKPTELALLATDPIRIEFEMAEVLV